MEKCITFSVPIEKELENGKKNKYRIKFVNSVRFMAITLWRLDDNLAEKLHKGTCKDCKPRFYLWKL